MFNKFIFGVVVVGAVALLSTAGLTAPELTGVNIERLGNKIVIHIEVDGSVIPILRYDEEARSMRVTLAGLEIAESSIGELPLADSDRAWISSIEFEDDERGAAVIFRLGEMANPLDLIVNAGIDEVTAVLYINGEIGFETSDVEIETPPSSRISEQDFSEGISIPVDEVPSADEIIPAQEEMEVETFAEDEIEAEIDTDTEAEVEAVIEADAESEVEADVEVETEAGVDPAEDENESTVPVTEAVESFSVTNNPIEMRLPNPPLFLDSGSDSLYEELFGPGVSQSMDQREMSFRYASQSAETNISLRVDELPLGLVIASLIDSTDFNVIISDAVADKTVSSLTLENISLFAALDLLTKSYNLSYILEYNTIVVGEKDTLEANFGKLITKTFWLDYADGENIKKILTDMELARENNVQVYNGETEYLSVTGAATLSGGIGDVGRGADIRQMPSLISTARRNMLVITETEERMTRIAQVIADLDKKPKQVRLEAEIVELSETGAKKLGLQLTDSLGSAVLTTSFGEAVPPDSLVSGQVESFKLQTFVRDPLNFQVSLNHLIEDGEGKVLAKPNMSAVDGTQAIYFAGQEVPYISAPAQSQGTTYTPATVEFKTVGITLNFKPRTDRDGNITIEVNPQVSSLVGFIDIGSGASAPQTQTRQATATVRVKSGEVFILGGMITEEERESFKRIPFLHKLPLFGPLFETKDTLKTRTEIIVIIRPVIEE